MCEIALQKNLTRERRVVLRNVSVGLSEGEYKCQISGEGPLFATVDRSRTLRVAVVPEEGPKVTKLPADFTPGSWLNLNCSAGPSIPPPRLTWFVNGKEVLFLEKKMETFAVLLFYNKVLPCYFQKVL